MSGYIKLPESILDSTLWGLPNATKLVWITMLLSADWNGEVSASVPGLARRAGVALEECETALASLLAPDPHSRTREHEGRRIRPIDGGWVLLNYAKHQATGAEERRRNRERQAKYRERQKAKARA